MKEGRSSSLWVCEGLGSTKRWRQRPMMTAPSLGARTSDMLDFGGIGLNCEAVS